MYSEKCVSNVLFFITFLLYFFYVFGIFLYDFVLCHIFFLH